MIMFMQRVINFLFHHDHVAAGPPPTPTDKFHEAADRLTKESQTLSEIVSANDDPLETLARNMRGETKRKRKPK